MVETHENDKERRWEVDCMFSVQFKQHDMKQSRFRSMMMHRYHDSPMKQAFCCWCSQQIAYMNASGRLTSYRDLFGVATKVSYVITNPAFNVGNRKRTW